MMEYESGITGITKIFIICILKCNLFLCCQHQHQSSVSRDPISVENSRIIQLLKSASYFFCGNCHTFLRFFNELKAQRKKKYIFCTL